MDMKVCKQICSGKIVVNYVFFLANKVLIYAIFYSCILLDFLHSRCRCFSNRMVNRCASISQQVEEIRRQ